jgi:hypothetical protein
VFFSVELFRSVPVWVGAKFSTQISGNFIINCLVDISHNAVTHHLFYHGYRCQIKNFCEVFYRYGMGYFNNRYRFGFVCLSNIIRAWYSASLPETDFVLSGDIYITPLVTRFSSGLYDIKFLLCSTREARFSG